MSLSGTPGQEAQQWHQVGPCSCSVVARLPPGRWQFTVAGSRAERRTGVGPEVWGSSSEASCFLEAPCPRLGSWVLPTWFQQQPQMEVPSTPAPSQTRVVLLTGPTRMALLDSGVPGGLCCWAPRHCLLIC